MSAHHIGAPLPRRSFGQDGATVSALAWGMWRFRGQDLVHAQALIEAALESGFDFFDTADIYGPDNGEPFGAAEALLGRVFSAAPSLRSGMTLATKAGIEMGVPYNSSSNYLARALDESLRRLQVEQVDLFQIHRPDLTAHPEEVAEALTRFRAAGKIKEAGVSNHTPAQVSALQAYLDFPLASIQPEFSPLAIEPLVDGVLDQAMSLRLTVLAWSPLGGGRVSTPSTPREAAVAEALDRVAASFEVSRAAAAYAWILAHPAQPIPIVGSQRIERIRAATDAFKIRFERRDWYAVLTAARGAPLP